MSYKKHKQLTLHELLGSPPVFHRGVHVVMSIAISTWKLCTYCLSLPTVVCVRVHFLFELCLVAYNGVQHILCCVFLRLLYPMLPVSLDRPFSLLHRCSVTFIYYIYLPQLYVGDLCYSFPSVFTLI